MTTRTFNTQVFLFILAIAMAVNAHSQSRTIESKLDQVLVYRQGALIQRTIMADIATGRQELRISGLSPDLDPNTVQVGTNSDVTLLSVGNAFSFLSEQDKPAQLIELEKSLEVVKEKIDGLEAELGVLNAEIQILEANREVKGENESLNIARLSEFITFYTQRWKSVNEKQRQLGKEHRRWMTEKQKIEQQIQEYNQSLKGKRTGEILLTISSPGKQRAEFEIAYMVRNAGWNASYKVVVPSLDSKLDITQQANIFNRSEELWKDAKISLSTGNAVRNTYLPQLSPWWLRFQEVYAKRNQNAGMEDRVMMEAMPAPSGPEVALREEWTTTRFDIEGQYTILPDGKPVTIAIDRMELPATYKYRSIPKLDPAAYLSAEVTDWESAYLVPGEMHLFLENTFVGKSFLDPGSVSDTLFLSLGSDEGISIEREQVKSFDKKQFLGNKVTHRSSFDITIKNTKGRSIDIQVQDQLPLSTHQDISVEAIELSGGKLNRETGSVSWDLMLNPGETRKIRLVYEVKYPKDKRLYLP